MSDDKSPGASRDDAVPGRPDRPRYGEYAPEGWTPPAPQQHWAPPPPPPKPGLIPLRPLFLADVIAGAFQVIRRNPRPTFWLALGIGFATSLIAIAIVGLVLWNTLSGVDPTTPPAPDTIRGIVVAVMLAALVAAIVQIVLAAIPQAVVTLEVARGTLGERRTLSQLWSLARGRVGALIGWMLIIGGGIAFVLILAMLGLAELAITGGLNGLLAAAGLGVLVALVLLAAAFWLGTRLAFVPALIVIERLPIGAAARRSWDMTRGSFWRILGITLLVNLIVQVGAQIITMPIAFLSSFVDQTQAIDARAIVVLIVSLIVQVVVTAVAIVVQAAVPTLLYLDIRMRREGFDAVLRAYVEARSGGATPSPDPFD